MGEKMQVSRRRFLGTATWVIGGLINAALAIPAIAFILGPALKPGKTQDWIRLGSTAKVELGTPTLFKVKVQRQTGWIVSEEQLSVYLLTEEGRDFVAMSNICTHLDCRVRWVSDREKFFCPCHNGIFDKDGSVISGPPPRPLDRYKVKIEDGQLFILGS